MARIALLDAADLQKLARLGAALSARESIRLCVSGNDVRDCMRVLGRRTLDSVTTRMFDVDLTPLDRLHQRCDWKRLPLRLAETQRRLVCALCDIVPPAAAQRMRLRFRPGYFNRSTTIDDVRSVVQVLVGMREHAELSARAICIFAC
ncbi:hypothetical protein WT27_14805 [Burkholderia territorii]|uniref:Uncharacterized protein n=1 Tax=Burkholderia territorii TaxID=1503055 RepID=A0A106DBP7_9BURK|nr:hypothetical protein WT27_14805 [Burkholderia territorii]KVX26252.1 hypothetical protein WT31_16730 [Burkholderia territorii]